MPNINECPCGSGKAFTACCEPYIKGLALAPTPEALMRARYSAYATGAIDFIVSTCLEDSPEKVDRQQTEDWSRKATWRGLRILSASGSGPGDSQGSVEFVASYTQDGKDEEHHERSRFVKRGNSWLFDSGEMVVDTVVRQNPKVGRNEPCPCGSGKKYKQCCGK